jgi:predicted mannosyl-3-phosphoglycerate phosphatase (HAD superfamily)
MGKTGFDNVVLKEKETVTVGSGDLKAQLDAIKADLDALAAAFNAHTHNGDGAQAGAYYTSPPRTNAATVVAGTASSVAITTK